MRRILTVALMMLVFVAAAGCGSGRHETNGGSAPTSSSDSASITALGWSAQGMSQRQTPLIALDSSVAPHGASWLRQVKDVNASPSFNAAYVSAASGDALIRADGSITRIGGQSWYGVNDAFSQDGKFFAWSTVNSSAGYNSPIYVLRLTGSFTHSAALPLHLPASIVSDEEAENAAPYVGGFDSADDVLVVVPEAVSAAIYSVRPDGSGLRQVGFADPASPAYTDTPLLPVEGGFVYENDFGQSGVVVTDAQFRRTRELKGLGVQGVDPRGEYLLAAKTTSPSTPAIEKVCSVATLRCETIPSGYDPVSFTPNGFLYVRDGESKGSFLTLPALRATPMPASFRRVPELEWILPTALTQAIAKFVTSPTPGGD